jgi:hypothetical protein
MSAGYCRRREHALILALQLQEVLKQLVERPDHIEGNPPEQALYEIEGVIAYLTPDDEDTTSNGVALRIVDNKPEVRS